MKIRQVVKETPDTVTIFFEQPEPYLDYKPGQYLTVILEIDGKEVRRSYSLCTSPFVDPYPGITIKRVERGLVSNYLNDQIRPGKTLAVMKPMGNFTTAFHSKNKHHYVMIAGGSGITPIMGITKSILINEQDSKVTLLYTSRSEEQVIFRKELEDLESKYSGNLRVIHNLSQPSSDWTGLKGRLDSDKVLSVIEDGFYPQSQNEIYFLCGPKGLMDAAQEALNSKGIPSKSVHRESFYTDVEAKEAALRAEGKLAPALTREVEVIVNGESFTYEVEPDKSILEAGLDNDVDMPYSCQSGLCTSCRGKLISGKVDMIEDAGLSENEIAEGYILCCSSKPASSGIKIIIE